MTIVNLRRVVPIVASAALLAASCGGDGDSAGIETLPLLTSPTTAAPPSTATTIPAEVEYYTIQQGDTLYGIAQSFGVTVDAIIAFNGIADPDAIEAGQKLAIPPAGVEITTTSSTLAPTTTP